MSNQILPTRGVTKRPFKGIVYGKPGVGKSSLLASNPKSVFVGTETNDNVNCLTHPDGISTSFQQFIDRFMWAAQLPAEQCDTIVVDTISEVEVLLINSFLMRGTNLNTTHKGFGAGREELKKRYFNFLTNQVNQAVNKYGKNVIFIARLYKENEMDEETGAEFIKSYPQIEKSKSYEMFAGEMDFIFSMKPLLPERTGELKTKGICIYTSPSAGSDAKNRFNLKPMYFIPYTEGLQKIHGNLKRTWLEITKDIDNFYTQFFPPKKTSSKTKKTASKPRLASQEEVKESMETAQPGTGKVEEPSFEDKAEEKSVEKSLAENVFDLMNECLKNNIKVTKWPLDTFKKASPERLEKFRIYYQEVLKQ